MTSSAKTDFVIPIVVLTAICIVTSVALATTEQITTPIIEEAARIAAEAARQEVLPGAASFEPVALDGMPEGVTDVFQAENGVVVAVTVKGYGGDIKTMFGIDLDGKIVKSKILSHTETAGLGSKITDESYLNSFVGKDSNLEGVEAIAGATVSSKAFMEAAKTAINAYSVQLGGTVIDPVGVTDEKLKAIFPLTESFTESEVEGNRVLTSQEGFVIFTTVAGLNDDMVVATCFDNEGVIKQVIVDSHGESEEIGYQVTEPEFTELFIGRTDSDVDIIVGATSSSNILKSAVDAAITLFATVKEG